MATFIIKFSIICAFLHFGLSQDTSYCSNENIIKYNVKGKTFLQTPDGRQQVSLQGLVSVTAGDRILMSIVRLQIFNADGKELVNPDGLDKAVVFDREDRPLLNNMAVEEGDTLTSIHIKKAIINMLPPQKDQSRTQSEIQDMVRLIEEGKREIILKDEYRDVILVLGNTGAGKSTFTHWITRSSNKLTSIQQAGGDYMIQDEQNKISDETNEPKTTFPDLVIDTETNTAYYDLPGFSDTRSSSNDLASSYFTTTVIEHAKAVKLVFVVNYSLMRNGVDRKDFILFLRHAADLVKNLNKYKDSIALIVTKVDNRESDAEVLNNGIVHFLNDVRIDLVKDQFGQTQENYKQTAHNPEFYNRATKLIDIFLSRDVYMFGMHVQNIYSRIKLFIKPKDSGSLDEMDILNKERDGARSMLNKLLNFTDVDVQDFGRTISDSSRKEIRDLVENVEKSILSSICKIASHIRSYFIDATDNINSKLSSIDMKNITIADESLGNAQKLLNNLIQQSNLVGELLLNMTDVQTLETVPRMIADFIRNSNITISKTLLSAMTNDGQYLKFLISSTDKEINIHISTLAWTSEFQLIQSDLISYHTDVSVRITDISQQLEKIIVDAIQYFTQKLKQKFYYDEEHTPDLFVVYEKMSNILYTLLAYNDTESCEINNHLQEYMARIEAVARFEYMSVDDLKEMIMKYNKYCLILNNNMNKYVVTYLKDTIAWYKFLQDLIISLSHYNIQSNTTKCFSVDHRMYWRDEGKIVKDSAIKQILKKCLSSDYDKIYLNIMDIKLDIAKLRHFDELISLLLGGSIQMCLQNGLIVIIGFHITTSDIINRTCPDAVDLMEIFALDTIFIDHDIDKTGKQIQLAMVAPRWVVTGNYNIVLNGLPGKSHVPSKAPDGYYPDVNGENGRPGLPGGTGGSFLGIGHTFVNEQSLTISSNGGDGGDGQDGGDGGRGKDGIRNREDLEGYPEDKIKTMTEEISSCTNGGDAGIKGSGGRGGYPGKVSVLSTSGNNLNIRIEQNIGRNGTAGENGRAGKPGASAKVNLDESVKKFTLSPKNIPRSMAKCNTGSAPSLLAVNNHHIATPKAPVAIDGFVVVEDYIEFAIKENGLIVETKVKKFISSLRLVSNTVQMMKMFYLQDTNIV